ncbi:hypothetical protein [Tenacibaculum ovolyticum]|uniref:hypothetical protein n=1 Tax=Tenacibaculum ovolyticum TaxID=104270 RepID=UPI000687CA67|nr:hypothetical protein [Tenacibaculum ovolyticum]
MIFKMLNSKTILALTTFAAISYSCSNNDTLSGKGNLKLSAKSTITNGLAKKTANTPNLAITKLLLNLKEFELELDVEEQTEDLSQNNENWDDDGKLDFEDEIELEGPFEIDLLSGQISFLDVAIPVGKYEELEFKFGPSTDEQSELFGKSILIEGTIDNIPFIYSNKFSEKIEIDFEDPTFDIIISEIDNGIVIDFDLNQIFNSVNGVDLSQAIDGNNDGVIEINHEDIDGNKALADIIKNKITTALDLLDD